MANITQVLFEGSKHVWREHYSVDVIIVEHSEFMCSEIIVSDPINNIEAPRIYVSSLLTSTLAENFEELLSSEAQTYRNSRPLKGGNRHKIQEVLNNGTTQSRVVKILLENLVLERSMIGFEKTLIASVDLSKNQTRSFDCSVQQTTDVVISRPMGLSPFVAKTSKNVTESASSLQLSRKGNDSVQLNILSQRRCRKSATLDGGGALDVITRRNAWDVLREAVDHIGADGLVGAASGHADGCEMFGNRHKAHDGVEVFECGNQDGDYCSISSSSSSSSYSSSSSSLDNWDEDESLRRKITFAEAKHPSKAKEKGRGKSNRGVRNHDSSTTEARMTPSRARGGRPRRMQNLTRDATSIEGAEILNATPPVLSPAPSASVATASTAMGCRHVNVTHIGFADLVAGHMDISHTGFPRHLRIKTQNSRDDSDLTSTQFDAHAAGGAALTPDALKRSPHSVAFVALKASRDPSSPSAYDSKGSLPRGHRIPTAAAGTNSSGGSGSSGSPHHGSREHRAEYLQTIKQNYRIATQDVLADPADRLRLGPRYAQPTLSTVLQHAEMLHPMGNPSSLL